MEERRQEVRGRFLQQFIGKFQDERELSVLQNHQALIQIFSILVPIRLPDTTEKSMKLKVKRLQLAREQILGLPMEPQNAPRVKKLKKESAGSLP